MKERDMFRRVARLFSIDLNAAQVAGLRDLNCDVVNHRPRFLVSRAAAFCGPTRQTLPKSRGNHPGH